MKRDYTDREIEDRRDDGRPYRLDLDVSDNRGGLPEYGGVYADGGEYHITAEIAAILARGFGKKSTSLEQSVRNADANERTYGAVMLLREEIKRAIANARFLAEPLTRMALFRQVKRERRAKQIIRTQIHKREAIHGPCPKMVRGNLFHQSVWKYTSKEIIFEPDCVIDDGWAFRHKWRWKYVKLCTPVGKKGTKLRKEYDLWMKRRIKKKRTPTAQPGKE